MVPAERASGNRPGPNGIGTRRVSLPDEEYPPVSDAVFVGEPMAGGLNFWDDVNFVRLDSMPIPMQVGVSTRCWEFAEPDDPRLTIEPDIPIAATAEDFLVGGDPVLDAALGK